MRPLPSCVFAFGALLAAQSGDPWGALLVPDATALAAARSDLAPAEDGKLSFRVHERAQMLVAADAAEQRRGGQYLLALLVAAADELAVPVTSWEQHDRKRDREWPLRRMRSDVLRWLGDLPFGGTGAEAAPAALWLWQHAEDGEERAKAAFALSRIRTPETDRLFQTIVDGGHTTSWAIRYALQQALARGLPVRRAEVEELCGYYEEGVRKDAAKLAAARGFSGRPLDWEHAFGARLEHTLLVAAALVVEPVPAGAPLVRLTVPPRREYGQTEPEVVTGFVLQAGGGDRPWRVVTIEGRLRELDGPGIDSAPTTLADVGKELIADRAAFAATRDTDERMRIQARHGIVRAFHSDNEPWAGSPAELMVAAWSLARGDRATAAGVLLDPVARAWDEDEYVQPWLFELATWLDEAMLQAFAGTHDYERALGFARRLVVPELRAFRHRERAVELLAQLPHRQQDFKALQLPTPAAWREQRKTLARPQQIAYLVERLRLLAAQQLSIPGGIDYGAEQYGTPFDGWRQGAPPADVRINPFRELLELNLAADELPALVPALESRDYILAYDLERFLPQGPQTLHRVAWVAASVCNEVAQQGIVDPREFLGDDAQRQQARAKFVDFCAANAGKHASDRLAARMLEVDDWQEVRRAFWNLHTLDAVRACQTMREAVKKRPEVLPQVVRLFALLDRAEFVGEARDWVRSDDADQRFFAALLLLRHRQDTEATFATVAARLRGDDGWQLLDGATEALLACGLPAARAMLVDALTGEAAAAHPPTAALAQRLLRAGEPGAFVVLDAALRGERQLRPPYGKGDDFEPQAAVVAEMERWWPEAGAAAADTAPGRTDEQRLDAAAKVLRARLAADWQAIQAGKPPSMTAAEPNLPWGDLLSYSTGWVRRM
jgi:hypothetical protein